MTLSKKEKKALYDKQRRAANPEVFSENAMRWSKANRSKVLLASRRHWIKAKYGISLEEYDEKLEQQNHCCEICGTHQSNYKRRFAVDHNHTTGAVRGLLCVKCNQAFGLVNEDVKILEQMIAYANKYALCSS